jgi:lipoyl(octanoyl) transferase
LESSTALPSCQVYWLGEIGYAEVFSLQRRMCLERQQEQRADSLLLLEHPAVFTLGRRGSWDDILTSSDQLVELGIDVQETNRGGLVTYHGPGQLVGYPIADLRRLAGDAPSYVTGLEETIIRALSEVGVVGFRDAAARGVWTRLGKIAAIGVAVSRGITMHGFAVNLQPDLSHFQLINPCGLGDRSVTSVERLLGQRVELDSFGEAIVFHFGQVFGRAMVTSTREDL